MRKYLVLSTVTNRTTETDTTRAGAEFVAAEAGIDIRDLHWQDRHSSLETERNWELSGRDGLAGSIHEIEDPPVGAPYHGHRDSGRCCCLGCVPPLGYVWTGDSWAVAMAPGWEDRAVELAQRAGMLPPTA